MAKTKNVVWVPYTISAGLIALFAALFIKPSPRTTQGPSVSENLQTEMNTLSDVVDSSITNNIHCCYSVNLAPHLPNGGFWVSADFLYWQANEDGLEFGTKMVGGPLIGVSSEIDTKLLDFDFEWNPGFRVGIGYVFDCYDHWALGLNWTHIHNRAHGKGTAAGIESQTGNIDTIVSPWVNLVFNLSMGASKADAHWDVQFNTLDLDLSRSFFVTERLVLNPYVGLRGARIDQDYKAKYNIIFLLMENDPEPVRTVTFKADNDFSSIGLRGGSDFIWHFNEHWNLFAKVSGAVLYGRFKVEMKNLNDQGLGEGEIDPMPLNFSASEHFWRTRLNFEEAIGFGWETFFCCNQYRLSASIAYEASQWLNQNQLFYTFYLRGQDTISHVPIRNQGNLGFQGIRAGVQFDF